VFLNPCCAGECSGICFIDAIVVRECRNKRLKIFNGVTEVGKSMIGLKNIAGLSTPGIAPSAAFCSISWRLLLPVPF